MSGRSSQRKGRSRSPWCVVMRLEDWIALYSAAEKRRNAHIKKDSV